MLDVETAKETNKLATELIKKFVDAIGYDGEEYIKMVKCPPILFIDNKILESVGVSGKYFSPSNKKEIESIVKGKKINEETIMKIKSIGCIGVIKKNNVDNTDLLNTLIHERFHYSRNFLIAAVDLKNDQIYDKDKYVQINDEIKEQYADLNQDVIKGSIDNSADTIQKYKNKSKTEIKNILWEYEKNDDNYHTIVDETLVELMAYLAICLYKKPQFSLMQHIENISKLDIDGEDIDFVRMVTMCNIIGKHKDFELFKWMINPMDYMVDDIHYDFFSKYLGDDDPGNIFGFHESDDLFDMDDPKK